MARNQEPRPLTEKEFEQLRADIEELQAETREALAEDLGGDPEDYRVDLESVGDSSGK